MDENLKVLYKIIEDYKNSTKTTIKTLTSIIFAMLVLLFAIIFTPYISDTEQISNQTIQNNQSSTITQEYSK